MNFTAKALRAALLVCTLGTVGCVNEVTDTEGRTFSYECKSGACILTQTKPPESNSDGGRRHRVVHEGRILRVCPEKNAPFDCRVLKCDAARVCSALGGEEFVCEKEICQAPERKITADDRLSLCLAGTGPWQPTPDQRELLTMARACQPPSCSVPSGCLAP